jgi:hypothetical protein
VVLAVDVSRDGAAHGHVARPRSDGREPAEGHERPHQPVEAHASAGRDGPSSEVDGVDPRCNRVQLAGGGTLDYDWLVLATGARHSYFGRDEWAANAPGLKSIEDALAIRRKVLLALEQTMVDLMREDTWSQLKHRSRASANAAERYLEQHELVFRAIRDRDARRAAQLMLMHMSEIETGLLEQIEQAEGVTRATSS